MITASVMKELNRNNFKNFYVKLSLQKKKEFQTHTPANRWQEMLVFRKILCTY